jgi:hypothetical protein
MPIEHGCVGDTALFTEAEMHTPVAVTGRAMAAFAADRRFHGAIRNNKKTENSRLSVFSASAVRKRLFGGDRVGGFEHEIYLHHPLAVFVDFGDH